MTQDGNIIVDIHFIYGDAETAKARNMARVLKYETKRIPPDEAIVKGDNFALPTFWALFDKYADNPQVGFRLVDNNVDIRKPVPVFSKNWNGLAIHNQGLFDKLRSIDYESVEGGKKYAKTKRTSESFLQSRDSEIQTRISPLIGEEPARNNLEGSIRGDREAAPSAQQQESLIPPTSENAEGQGPELVPNKPSIPAALTGQAPQTPENKEPPFQKGDRVAIKSGRGEGRFALPECR